MPLSWPSCLSPAGCVFLQDSGTAAAKNGNQPRPHKFKPAPPPPGPGGTRGPHVKEGVSPHRTRPGGPHGGRGGGLGTLSSRVQGAKTGGGDPGFSKDFGKENSIPPGRRVPGALAKTLRGVDRHAGFVCSCVAGPCVVRAPPVLGVSFPAVQTQFDRPPQTWRPPLQVGLGAAGCRGMCLCPSAEELEGWPRTPSMTEG